MTSAKVAILALVVAAGLLWLTGEPGISGAIVLGRLAALGPPIGAFATRVVVRRRQVRGESRALAALGVPPSRVSRGAIVGGVGIAFFSTLALLLPSVSLDGLFPMTSRSFAWHAVDGTFVGGGGWKLLLRNGQSDVRALPLAPQLIEASIAHLPSRIMTSLALASYAVALPVWSANAHSASSRVRFFVVVIAFLLAVVIFFHLVAAGEVSALLLIAPILVISVDVWLESYGGTRPCGAARALERD